MKMTLAEFKAWFEGFTEDMDGPPNEKQWKRIKARVKDIDGTVTTYPIYIDRYWPGRVPVWEPYITYTSTAAQTTGGSEPMRMENVPQSAFVDLGRADYQAL